MERRDLTAGGAAHDQGTILAEIYMEHADKALGFRSFRKLLEKKWPLDVSVACERMRVARLCTHHEATTFGYSVCALGLRVMTMLGVTSFAEFRKEPLKLHADDGGGTVHFPAPASALRSVLRALAVADEPPTELDIGELLRRYRAAVNALLAGDPGIAAVKPVVWADAKGAYVRATAGTAAQASAAERLYRKLARVAR